MQDVSNPLSLSLFYCKKDVSFFCDYVHWIYNTRIIRVLPFWMLRRVICYECCNVSEDPAASFIMIH
jgi:hypothetical protein